LLIAGAYSSLRAGCIEAICISFKYARTLKGGFMSDNKSERASPDNKRIDVHDANELRNWTKTLKVTPEQLKAAVDKVGTSAAKVREYLQA
jgi:hypothetical protein